MTIETLSTPIAAPPANTVRFDPLDGLAGLVIWGTVVVGGTVIPLMIGVYHLYNNLFGS